ncbi:ATPase E1-E2 type family protein / haloacid dehalogenase-like hydrolase family protein [Perilla frutescens var. frutescens]|nr:ATPase E1-E2 type family protein / haloacid dehalogenase-like hydrolase family protein [Perilla frutescens var. frutescens]
MFLTKAIDAGKPCGRLQIVFRAIYFITSLSKKSAGKKNLLLSSDNPYIAIDIESITSEHHDAEPFLHADKKAITDLVREKNFDSLVHYGGVKEVVKILETDMNNGINNNSDGIKKRSDEFGSNTYQKAASRSFISFLVEAFKDPTIIILLVCAALSLGFGMKQHGPKEGWYDGGSIIVAVVLVLAVSAISNFKQSQQFSKLSEESSNIQVEVVRDGRRQPTSIFNIVVGDIVCLKIGDQVPADGLFLNGHSMKIDESSMTGESDLVDINEMQNPFLISGTKVKDGYGRMLVTSVGMNTTWGQMMGCITNNNKKEHTPLEQRLTKLTTSIGKIGLFVAAVVLIVLIIRYFTGTSKDESGHREFIGSKTKSNDIMNSIVRIIAAAVTIIVVAIPEGLPLAVTLTLAYSMKRMMADHAMVRELAACEAMGSATIICTDKTGTLTLNKMQVTQFWIGQQRMEEKKPSEISSNVLELIAEGAALNTTGEVHISASSPVPEISGSPTESAILSWAVSDMEVHVDSLRKSHEILHVEAFNSDKKRSGILVRNIQTDAMYIHWKGAAEMILSMCKSYYVHDGVNKAMNDEERKHIENVIIQMASNSLRCIAFACKESAECTDKLEETGFTLLGIVGIKDPCRPGVKEAVESCKRAGVQIKMITGDNMFTAKAIALECGILDADDYLDDAMVDGETFRNYSHEERLSMIERIRVMARSSPFDKLLMVQCLKLKGHVIAVTGDGTNDGPALKEADIGLSMGIQGTEVAKECSDIVIMDDNFSTVVTVLKWGRCVYNNIQKFIQFQLTVNIAALVINFIAALSSGDIPLTAVQLLWVNLIMDTLGALALATEQPTNELLKKKPVDRAESLISKTMWRNLISQALYQVTVLLVLQFKGSSIFHVNKKVKDTLIFNTFVLCQVFNEFNARQLEKKNIFKGVTKNKLFLGIVGITVVLQVIMVEFLKKFANTERLNIEQWAACIGVAALSWPIGEYTSEKRAYENAKTKNEHADREMTQMVYNF